jgi:predicted phage tail component-like protein
VSKLKNFSFNGVKKDYLYVLEGSNRLPWAPIQRIYQDVPNRPGTVSKKGKKVSARPLSIPVAMRASTREELQVLKEDFAAWLIHDEPKALVFDDEPNRTYYAQIDGSFDVEEFLDYGRGIIPFICPDPYKYGSEKTVNSLTVTNNGTVEANPIITASFTSSASEYKIAHSNGKYVRVIYNFVSGNKLEIDLTKRKVTINGNLQMAAYDWRSQPFALMPGSNSLTVTPSGRASTSIKFRERWL